MLEREEQRLQAKSEEEAKAERRDNMIFQLIYENIIEQAKTLAKIFNLK